MKLSAISLLPVLVIAAACGGSGTSETADLTEDKPDAAPTTGPAPEEILGMVYNAAYDVPDGFFVDERANTTARSYTVHHVLDESNSYELCSDDLVEAQALEQADNESRSVGGYYVTSYENDRYFEFVRELAYDQSVGNVDDPTSPGYARVFKCGHTNRNGVDRALLNGYSGTISLATPDNNELKDFTEYLWQFRFFNVSRKVVLDSYFTAGMSHTLLLAFVVNQGTGACDRVDVIEWRFYGDPATGEVTRDFKTTQSFAATIEGGIPKLCE